MNMKWVDKLEDTSDIGMAFVSGRPAFVAQHCSELRNRKVWATCPASHGHRLDKLKKTSLSWKLVEHSSVGGNTRGACWIGSDGGRTVEVTRDPNARFIRDALSSTESGVDFDNPNFLKTEDLKDAGGKEVLLGNDLLPIRGGNRAVITPSVFSKTGWARRLLAPHEVAACCDLPVPLHHAWDLGRRAFGRGEIPFQDSTPSKVLSAVRESVLLSLGPRETARAQGVGEEATMTDLPPLPTAAPTEKAVDIKAAKADDAETNVKLWDDNVRRMFEVKMKGVNDESLAKMCSGLRKCAHRWWQRNIQREAVDCLRNKFGSEWNKPPKSLEPTDRRSRERLAALDALDRVWSSNYWDWSGGSALFFWRWPPDFQDCALEGCPVHVTGKFPRFMRQQPKPKDPAVAAKVAKKLSKVRARKCVEIGRVQSLTSYFDVPKAGDDIRMVHDASACGLNAAVWAPNFILPGPDSLCSSLDADAWMSDINLGEMFLNFPLDPAVRPCTGVDLTPCFGSPGGAASARRWERWSRCLMGFRPSPCNASRSFAVGEELTRSNPADESLPFCWSHVELNLPGDPLCDPSRPWVSKRCRDGTKAADLLAHCDDIRTLGPARSRTLLATGRVAKIVNFLGMQDAPRKRRFPTKRPGAWAGTLACSDATGSHGTISQERWDLCRKTISELLQIATDGKGMFEHKRLLSDRGQLACVGRTCPTIRPCLKGLHLTIDSWRPGRAKDGWKEEDWDGFWKEVDDGNVEGGGGLARLMPEEAHAAPNFVRGVPRLKHDLAALQVLFSSKEPGVRCVRPASKILVKHGFADASGAGFGGMLSDAMTSRSGMSLRVGCWGADMEGSSSNHRELRNLAEHLEKEAAAGRLTGVELFIFTDDATAERCFFEGTSSSRVLFKLVLRLRKLEMVHGIHLHVTRCAGKRLIAQGTDGLSQGAFLEGALAGEDFLSFVPLHKSAVDRSPSLEAWARSWMVKRNDEEEDSEVEFLAPRDWFERGHDIAGWVRGLCDIWHPKIKSGTCVWSPPPAAAMKVVEELRRARLKRQDSAHIVLIPPFDDPPVAATVEQGGGCCV